MTVVAEAIDDENSSWTSMRLKNIDEGKTGEENKVHMKAATDYESPLSVKQFIQINVTMKSEYPLNTLGVMCDPQIETEPGLFAPSSLAYEDKNSEIIYTGFLKRTFNRVMTMESVGYVACYMLNNETLTGFVVTKDGDVLNYDDVEYKMKAIDVFDLVRDTGSSELWFAVVMTCIVLVFIITIVIVTLVTNYRMKKKI